MSALESLALVLTGLVFFFLGLDGVKASLKSLTSRSMRRRARAAVSSPLRAAFLGVSFGALSQSATAVSFLLAGLVSARLLPLSRALSVVAWANPGTAILAFLAAVNLQLATLWIIGLAGLGLRNGRVKSLGTALGVALGIGFLLFGLTQLKRAAAPIQEAEWFESVGVAINGSLVLGFISGALLRVVIQSSSAIVVILIALCGKGLLGAEQAMMIIHGTGVGIGVSVLLLGQGLRGEALRISYWQAIINAVAAVLLGGWMLFAATDLLPSLPSLLARAGLSIETDLAIGFLLQMLMCPALGALLERHAQEILSTLAPESVEDELARPRYIDEGSLEESEIALELVGREQSRVAAALPSLLDRARLDVAASSGMDAVEVRKALETLNAEISGFLAELAVREHDASRGQPIVSAIARQQALTELVESIDGLAGAVAELPAESASRVLGGRLAEATDVMVGMLRDWLERGDQSDRDMLALMTEDRGEQMESVRRGTVTTAAGSTREQAAILYVTSLFERTVYLMRRAAS